MRGSILGSALLFLTCASVGADEDFGTFEARRKRVIARGIAFLRKGQSQDGAWSQPTGRKRIFPGAARGGPTLLTLHALTAGGATDDVVAARAIDWMLAHPEEFPLTHHDSPAHASVRLRVLLAARPAAARSEIDRLHAELLRGRRRAGGWGLNLRAWPNGPRQMSAGPDARLGYVWATAMATLALREAELQIGLRTPREVWRSNVRWLLRAQNADGSWGRHRLWVETDTPLGLAALVASAHHGGVSIRTVEKPIRRALKRIESYPFERGRGHYWYLLFLAEADRVLLLGRDGWFRRGAEFLFKTQLTDGTWPEHGPRAHRDFPERNEVHASPRYRTAVAVFFLSRAGTITPGERWPGLDPKKPDFRAGLSLAFDLYRRYAPVRRVLVATRFRKVKRQAVGFLLPVLESPDKKRRTDAWELLRRLADPPVRFRAKASDEHRTARLKALRDWWAKSVE